MITNKKINTYTLLFFVCLLPVFLSVAQQQQRPNILLLFADDWGRHASIYQELEGDKSHSALVKTPNFDAIAKNGVLFTNAHVNAPSCTPSRSALLSGQYFYRTGLGSILLGAQWDDQIPSYPLLLQNQGYDIGYMYKVWSPGTPRDAPYGGRKNAFENHGGQFNQFSQYVADSENIEEAKEKLYAQVRGNFQDFLKARNQDQPFCFWFGPTNVHRSWVKGSGKKIWDINPDELKGKLPGAYADVPEIREDFADYLGEVQAFDAGIGVLIEELKKIGEYENTLIVISGDHGAAGFARSKTNLYDIGTHVPLAISWPGKIKGQRVVTDFVNLMDLAPTFLDAGGVSVPEVMTGKSLMPILLSDKQGRVDIDRYYVLTGKERHVDVTREENLPYPQRAITTDDYLYIRNFKPDRWPQGSFEMGMLDIDAGPTKDWIYRHFNDPTYKVFIDYAHAKRPYEELYNLKKDPEQLYNVAGLSPYHEAKSNLSDLMDIILIETNDPRMNENPPFENPPFTDRENDTTRWDAHLNHLKEVHESNIKTEE